MTPAERESALRSRGRQRGSSNPRGASAHDAQQLRGYGRRTDDLESNRAAMDVKLAELSDIVNWCDAQRASMQMLVTFLEGRLSAGTSALEASETQHAELHWLYQALCSEHKQLSSLHAARGQQIAQLQHQLAGASSEHRLTTDDQAIVKANDEVARA